MLDVEAQLYSSQDAVHPQHKPMTLDEEIDVLQSRIRNLCNASIDPMTGRKYKSVLPQVPVIDISKSFSTDLSERREVAIQVRKASESVGFFLIKNHHIPKTAIEEILGQTKRFFHRLTTEQKDAMHQRNNKLFKGFEKDEDIYGNGTRNDPNAVETRESFNNFYEPSFDPTGGDGKYIEMDGFPIGHEDPDGLPRRANFWPQESDLPGFKSKFGEYYHHVQTLALHLTRIIALSLDLPENYFDDVTRHPGGMLKLIHYPPQTAETLRQKQEQEGQGQGKLSLLAHADQEFLTILLTSGAPGLEILLQPSPETENRPVWITAPQIPDTLIINVGDGLARLTNDRYKSAVHRVVARSSSVNGDELGKNEEEGKKGVEARYSVPFFFNLDFDAVGKYLPEHAVGKSRFAEVTNAEYIWTRTGGEKQYFNQFRTVL